MSSIEAGRKRTSLFSNPYLLLTTTMLLWAGNSIAGRLAVGEISPMSLTTLRWVFVGIAMLAFYRRALVDNWALLRRHKFFLIFMGSIGFTAYNAMFYWAAHSTTAVNINIITGAMPAMILIGGLLVFGQAVRPLQWVGVIVSIIGVIVVATRGDLAALAALTLNHGDALILIATVLYAIYSLFLRKRPAVPSMVFFAAIAPVAAVSSLFLLAGEIASEGFTPPTLKGWAILIYVAAFPSLVAQVFFIKAVEIIGPGRAGLFINLIPVFGSAMAVLLLDEAFALYHAIALALVLVGILIAEYRPKSPVRAAPET